MNRKSQDSTDELLREMRALLEEDLNGASDEALDEGTRSTRTVADIDEDIAEWLSANEIWLNGIMDL